MNEEEEEIQKKKRDDYIVFVIVSKQAREAQSLFLMIDKEQQ